MVPKAGGNKILRTKVALNVVDIMKVAQASRKLYIIERPQLNPRCWR